MALDHDNRTDVAIIGGGVVGVACALELARRGASVRVLERDRIGYGCSHGNAGWLTPSLAKPLAAPDQWRSAVKWLGDPESPFYIKPRADLHLVNWLIGFLAASRRDRYLRGAEALVSLCRDSLDAWEAWDAEEASADFDFARNGLLTVYESNGALEAARTSAELTARFGVPFEEWNAEAVYENEPAVRGIQIGGIHFPRDGRCDSYQAVLSLEKAARTAGVDFVEGAEVLDAETGPGGLGALRTTRGRIEASDYVLAAGAWSGSLGARLGLRLPMQGAKGYSIVVPPLEPHPQRSLYLAERMIAVNPQSSCLRISGTLEIVGEDLSVNTRRLDGIVRGVRSMLPLGEPLGEIEIWRGLRPCLPDSMPAIGRTRSARNLWLATGHQMVGLKTAPGTGQLLADLMTGESPSIDPEPFRADRYC